MKVEQITIKNYKMFRNTTVSGLQPMSVFLGANGAGKSTFFDVLGFLSDALKENVTIAINKRGGFKEVISRGSDESQPIEFEIKFRNTVEGQRSPLITYLISIVKENGKILVAKEILQYRRGGRGKPWQFIRFSKGEGDAISNEQDYGSGKEEQRTPQKLSSPDILAIKGLGQFEQFKAVSAFRQLLEGWFVCNLHIDAARSIGDVGYASHLSSRGENLAQVTKFIFENHPETFELIRQKMKERVPGVGDISAVQNDAGQIILKFQDGSFKDPFIARYVSDGTIKMFAYLVLLHDPSPHPLLCIEEPENFLYPHLLDELADELREYAHRGGQVFITTHSPDFVNALEIEELFYIVKQNGLSHISKASENVMIKNLFEEGEKLGWLWSRNYFKEDGLP